MTSKSQEKPKLQVDSFNILNNRINNKSMFFPNINNMKQDLLFFKNDILKDLRKINEKINLKLTEQSVVNNEQYEAYEKKLDLLTKKITQMDTKVTDNTNISQQLNRFQVFQAKAEDNLFTLNSRIMNTQKESKDSIIKIEKMLDENLKYPGIIGKNCKYPNFRFFVDFVITNIKSLNDFRVEIQNYELSEFKRKINSELQDIRFVISDNYKSMRRLSEKNIKDFDSRLNVYNNKNDIKFDDLKNVINDFKNKINDYLLQYMNKIEDKFNNFENNISEKYEEQIQEINNLKIIKNKFINDIDDIKEKLIKNEKSLEYIKNNYEKNLLLEKMNKNNYLSENNKKMGEKDDGPSKKILSEKKKESGLTIGAKNLDNINSDIKIYDTNMQNTEKTYSENTLDQYTNLRENNINIIEHSKSYDKSQNNEMSLKNYYSDEHNEFRHTKESIAYTQDINKDREKINNMINLYTKKSMPNMNLIKYTNSKKAIFPNNYSITNIPDIKIKKVVLPESLNRINKYIRLTRSSLLDTKGKRILSNNPSMTQKYYLKNSENNTTSKNRRTSFNVTKICKHKNSRSKGFKLIESARILNGRQNSMKSDINSLAAVKTKYQNNILNSAHNIRRNQNRNWSFEKNKNEKVQIGFRNTYNAKNKFKELMLVNARNLKKKRKIKV